MLWITDARKKNVPLDNNIIREKAKQLYKTIAGPGGQEVPEEEEDESGPSMSSPAEEFQASRGWFDRFQKLFMLKSATLHGKAASADNAAAAAYPGTLHQIIQEKGYKPEQVIWTRLACFGRKCLPEHI